MTDHLTREEIAEIQAKASGSYYEDDPDIPALIATALHWMDEAERLRDLAEDMQAIARAALGGGSEDGK